MHGLIRSLVAALAVASAVAASTPAHVRRKAKTSSSHAASTGDVAILQSALARRRSSGLIVADLLAIEQASSSFYKRANG